MLLRTQAGWFRSWRAMVVAAGIALAVAVRLGERRPPPTEPAALWAAAAWLAIAGATAIATHPYAADADLFLQTSFAPRSDVTTVATCEPLAPEIPRIDDLRHAIAIDSGDTLTWFAADPAHAGALADQLRSREKVLGRASAGDRRVALAAPLDTPASAAAGVLRGDQLLGEHLHVVMRLRRAAEANEIQLAPDASFLHDGRGLASWARVDVLYQAYFTRKALFSAGVMRVPPIKGPRNEGRHTDGSRTARVAASECRCLFGEAGPRRLRRARKAAPRQARCPTRPASPSFARRGSTSTRPARCASARTTSAIEAAGERASTGSTGRARSSAGHAAPDVQALRRVSRTHTFSQPTHRVRTRAKTASKRSRPARE